MSSRRVSGSSNVFMGDAAVREGRALVIRDFFAGKESASFVCSESIV